MKDYTNLLEEAEALRNNIENLSENRETDNDAYSVTRIKFMGDPELKALLPDIVISNRHLGGMWDELKSVASGGGSWGIRRQYLTDEFAPLIQHLEQKALFSNTSPHEDGVTDTLSSLDSAEVSDLWQKAIERCDTDPTGAITAGRSLVESACKNILDELGVDYKDSDAATSLYKKVAKELNLSPDQHTEQVFKQVLSGASNVVGGMASVANEYGDRHGGGKSKGKPSPRHARLVVNLAGSITAFLIDTRNETKN